MIELALTEAERVKAERLLAQLRPSWDEIQPAERVRAIAEDLPDRYGVRALAAMQLAAALVWCRERPNRRPFICFDERLSAAAAAAGFIVRNSQYTLRDAPVAEIVPNSQPIATTRPKSF